MFLHDLKSPVGSRKRRKIVGRGRGTGHGKTSGKGHKGQKSRSGRATLLGLEGGQVPLIRRLPKFGFRSKAPVLNQVVNIESLNRFASGAVITAESLKKEGLISSLNKPFKILGNGELKKSVIVKEGSISKSAQDKIVKAGGKVEIESETQAAETKETKVKKTKA
jgi:large subunit ribosomal protein L15